MATDTKTTSTKAVPKTTSTKTATKTSTPKPTTNVKSSSGTLQKDQDLTTMIKKSKMGKSIAKNLLMFLLSLIFPVGVGLWAFTKQTNKTTSDVCLFGALIGVLLIFIIGFLGGAMNIV